MIDRVFSKTPKMEHKIYIPLEVFNNYYSLRPTFFVLFEKSNFLREHHLLSCLPFKNI